jgi:CheY-like chemotaxis protein
LGSSILLLLVEDQPLISELMQSALQDGGFEVMLAANGFEALQVLDERIADLAGIITDVRLGAGPDGWQLACHARELRPDFPVIYMTGADTDEWAARGVPKSLVLQKPFATIQLLTAIAMLLNDAGGGPG